MTPETKLPFGKHKGLKLRECPRNYLEWMQKALLNTDLHEFAVAAKTTLELIQTDLHAEDLNKIADEFLRKHGIKVDRSGNIL